MPEAKKQKLTPVHYFSHGTPTMLGEESPSADYWKECGTEALRHGVKHIIIMVRGFQELEAVLLCCAWLTDHQGAHWGSTYDKIEVAMNPNPWKDPIGGVHPRKYYNYKLKPDLPMGERVIKILQDAGFNCVGNKTCAWIHDVYTCLIRMFPNETMPPATIISNNARFDPHYHTRIGLALRDLRKEPDVMFLGTGGAVHNLYRNVWGPILWYKDNFAMPVAPAKWALNFRQEMEDALLKNTGPNLKRAVVSLMKLPDFRDAHGTDDHFIALCFCAGLVSHEDDIGTPVRLAATDWELVNMCNDQYTWGDWEGFPVTAT